MIRNVKPPRNLKHSCSILGDLGCELRPVVRRGAVGAGAGGGDAGKVLQTWGGFQ